MNDSMQMIFLLRCIAGAGMLIAVIRTIIFRLRERATTIRRPLTIPTQARKNGRQSLQHALQFSAASSFYQYQIVRHMKALIQNFISLNKNTAERETCSAFTAQSWLGNSELDAFFAGDPLSWQKTNRKQHRDTEFIGKLSILIKQLEKNLAIGKEYCNERKQSTRME